MILFSGLAVAGVLMVLIFFDLSGIHAQPLLIRVTPINLPDLNSIAALINLATISEGDNLEERINPNRVEIFPSLSQSTHALVLPEPEQTQGIAPEVITTPEPTSTPKPPLDPTFYRTEVTLRAKNFASALEAFLSANDRLRSDEKLFEDLVWRAEMGAILDQVAETGQALSAIGPPPPEYEAIHAWLVMVGPEAESLRGNYNQSLESRDPAGFTTAGRNLNQIKVDLSAALYEMSVAGWPLE